VGTNAVLVGREAEADATATEELRVVERHVCLCDSGSLEEVVMRQGTGGRYNEGRSQGRVPLSRGAKDWRANRIVCTSRVRH